MSKRLSELDDYFIVSEGVEQKHMSTKLSQFEYPRDYELGERVSFNHEYEREEGRIEVERLIGEVVRVYNARDDYHVEVDGIRYQVHRHDDDMRPER
jgi:hypothetical protein